MSSTVTYEHPLNERIRTVLRLELLLRQVTELAAGDAIASSRAFLSALLELLAVLSRGDIKNEVIRELERLAGALKPLAGNGDADQQQLETVLRHLQALRETLHGDAGPLGHTLRRDELISAVRQRSEVPGGTGSFDLPFYHWWLTRPADVRQHIQQQWLNELKPLRQSVELILKMIRNSAESSSEVAERGGFQRSLERDVAYQLVRVTVSAELECFAQVSGSRYRFSVQFLDATSGGRPRQTETDVPFQLTCCAL